MKIVDKLQNIVDLLNMYNQEHIVKFLEKIDGKVKEDLIEQITKIDFEHLMALYAQTQEEIDIKENVLSPIKCLDKDKITLNEKEKLTEIGEEIIRSGQYAVVTMAGGQGTRLGHTGPKGTFKLDIYGKGKYLFEILSDNLKEANEMYNVTIPWYIMTSEENNDETIAFMEKHRYFGYPRDKVIVFMQSQLPIVDFNGKLLLTKNNKIKEGSDGNGGTYSSLRASGALAKMKEDGIKWIFIGGVDNVLLKMADVILLGLAVDKKVQIASKSVIKANPEEKVGIFCKLNGVPKVIEYAELPEKMAKQLNEDGELKYGESNIMCHLYSIEAIEKISKKTLMYHYAKKKNAYVNIEGKEIIPTEPNSYKFESFIFDAFELFEDMALLRVKRKENFAPIKNAEGVDSPRTAKELYEKYWENEFGK